MGIAGKTFCFLLAGVMVLLWNTSALAKVLYVSPDGNDLNDGTSWMRAKRSITAALAVARAGDQIWARYGVYYERITLKDGVSLYGGFRGTEQTLSERPSFPRSSPDPYETVLDGQQGGSVVTTPSSASRTYRLDGFTVRNGNSSYGGGLYCVGLAARRLVVANCTISGNTANGGGGVYCVNSSPTLTNCTIAHNAADVDGGAIASDGGGSVVNTLIAFNTSGIYYSAGAPDTFHHNCVWGNDAYNYSGIPDPTGTDGNISTDPLMIACHLLPGSPCIDAGDNRAVGSDWTDFDGEPRIGGSQVDIGADEFYAPIVQGWITFSDYVSPPPPFVPFEVRAGSTEVQQILVDPDGGFVVPGVPVGAFALSVKPLSYLRRTVDVDTRRGSVLGLQLELVNGDIDGDNEVTLFDFGRLVAAFGSAPGDANWDENADLDGDEEITLFDFGILVRNFGEVGDD